MATIVKTPSDTWKAVIRKRGCPTTSKTFRTRCDAADRSRRAEDEMVRGVYLQRSPCERMTLETARKRYPAEVTPTKRPSTQLREKKRAEFQEALRHFGNRIKPHNAGEWHGSCSRVTRATGRQAAFVVRPACTV